MAHNYCISRRWIHLALCLVLAAGWLAARPVPAAQATGYNLYVDEEVDYYSEPGGEYAKCEGTDYSGIPDCSLRGAITLANSDPNNRYTIYLKSGETYTLTRVGAGEDNNSTGDLDITTNLTIFGTGATLNANGIDRVIDFNAPAPGLGETSALIWGLTITGGHAPDGVDGAATLEEKRGEGGGGIRIKSGNLRLNSVTVADNQSGAGGKGRDGREGLGGTGEYGESGGMGGLGGGIYVQTGGVLRTDHCQIIGNFAGNGGDGGSGGPGMDNNGNPGTGGSGGDGGSGGSGGGIYAGSNTLLLLEHTSIIDNSAGDGGNGGCGGDGSMGVATTPAIDGGNGGTGGHGGLGGSGGGVYAATLDVSHSLYFGSNTAGKAGDGGLGGEGGDGSPSYSDGGNGGDGGNAGMEGGQGGGFALTISAKLSNAVFVDNSSGSGGSGGAGGSAGLGRYDGAAGATQIGSMGGLGGAILAKDVSELKLNFTTIVSNITGSHGAGFVPAPGQFFGGGISARGPVTIKNSILYDNTASGSLNPDNCHRYHSGEVQYTGGHNLFQSTDGCVFEPIAADTPADIFDSNPQLFTSMTPPEPWMAPIALRPGSPAIDQIPTAECVDWPTPDYPTPFPVTVDLWKQPRPSGFGCDIGAYEFPLEMVFLPAVIR